MISSTQWIVSMLWIIQGTAVALYVLSSIPGYSGDEKTSAHLRDSIWRYANGCCWTVILLVALLFFFAPALTLQKWQESMTVIFRTSSQIWLIMCLSIWLFGRMIAVVMVSRKKASATFRIKGERLVLPFIFGLLEMALALVMGT